MVLYQSTFLKQMLVGAYNALHPFPAYAASEAALESGYGVSEAFIKARNPFGLKQHAHPIYGTLSLPTREFLHGSWVVVDAEWVLYPTYDAAFKDRLDTLKRMTSLYGLSLAAKTGEEFIIDVSKHWSTDPQRAQKVLAVHATAVRDGVFAPGVS
jgi:flagellum-specific peptidoglycan hydrolase FlgJ